MSSNLPKVTQLECPSTDRTVYLVLYPLLLIPGLCLPTSKKRCYIRGHKQQEYPKDHEALILRPMTPSSIIFFLNMCRKKKITFLQNFSHFTTFLESRFNIKPHGWKGECAGIAISVFQTRKQESGNVTHLSQDNTARQWQSCSCNLGLLA